MSKLTVSVLKAVCGSAVGLLVLLTASSALCQKSSSCSGSVIEDICCPKIVAGVNPILFFSPNKFYKFSIQIANPDTCDYHINGKILTSPDDNTFFLEDGVNVIPAGTSAQLIIDFGPIDSLHKYKGQLMLISQAPCTDTTVLSWEFSNPLSVDNTASSKGFTLSQNYPNPVASTTIFSYTTRTEAPVNLSIRDINGRIVKGISNGYVSAGEHNVTTDLSDLSNGTYIICLESGNGRKQHQIVISH